GSSSFTVNWADGGNAPGTFYTVRISSTDSSFSTVSGSSTTQNSLVAFTGLAPNATYYAQAQATGNAGDQSGWTAFASTSTLAALPGPVTFTGVGSSSFTVNWADGGNAPG